MLFNSLVFLAFFALVYPVYLLLRRRLHAQNLLLLVASLVFYGWWDWRFLSLLCFTSFVDYWVALGLGPTDHPTRRRRLLAVSVVSNLTVLGTFKYFGFFADSAAALMRALGMDAHPVDLNIVLPVGISFYTFQAMSYTIDVYRGHLRPVRNPIDFFLYITYFPQLVAGPIERATHLIPQVIHPRTVKWADVNAGLHLIVAGYVKKVVVADNLARIADAVFAPGASHSGPATLVGVLAFTFQIYADFSGYSDIARGLAKLMGFDLMVNFKLPYFALDPSDFWRRWHISLSTWLRDYLYIPLGGNRMPGFATYRNLMLTMLLGGLWHGAAWNFVLWGAFHGAILCLYRAGSEHRLLGDRTPPLALRWFGMFALTLIGWILFRSKSAEQIGAIFSQLFSGWTAPIPETLLPLLLLVLPVVAVQIWQQRSGNLLAPLGLPTAVRIPIYAILLVAIFLFGVREGAEFIYFQF